LETVVILSHFIIGSAAHNSLLPGDGYQDHKNTEYDVPAHVWALVIILISSLVGMLYDRN
jgi:hypothetical protein